MVQHFFPQSAISFVCLLLFSGSCLAGMEVSNFKSGEEIRYPVPLIRGTLSTEAKKIVAINHSNSKGEHTVKGAVHQGKFKVLTELVPGLNKITFKSDVGSTTLQLRYKPMTTEFKLRCVYYVESKSDLTYETSFKNDKQDFRGKFDTACKLMQSYTAEMLHRAGYGRKTFNLDLDENGKVRVYVIECKGVNKWKGGRNGLFGRLAGKKRGLPKGPFKNLGIPAFSRKIKGTGHASHYTALGGGDFALMGGATFYTWPANLNEVVDRFMDPQRINIKEFHADDSARYAVFATASQTIGNSLHELGHCYQLPHTAQKNCIMYGGGAYFHRLFTFREPPHRKSKEWLDFGDNEKTVFGPVTIAHLNGLRWLHPDKREWAPDNTISYQLDPETSEVVVKSKYGMAFAAIEHSGRAQHFKAVEPGKPYPKELRFSPEWIKERFEHLGLGFRTYDAEGHSKNFGLGNVLTPECIGSWHIDPSLNQSWKKNNYVPMLKTSEVAAAAKKCDAQPLHQVSGDYITMEKVKDIGNTTYKAMYAHRSFRSSRSMKVAIKYDFNDVGRIYLNGKMVAYKKMRSMPKRDRFEAEGTIRNGSNSLLVEIGNEKKASGFYLRMEDEDGTPIRINDKDELEMDRSFVRAKLVFDGPYVKSWKVAEEMDSTWQKIKRKWPPVPLKTGKVLKDWMSKADNGKSIRNRSDALDFSQIHERVIRSKPAGGFATTRFVSQKTKKVKLITSATVYSRIWFNGELIDAIDHYHKDPSSEKEIEVEMKRGENKVYVEAYQKGNRHPWRFFLRLEDLSGKQLGVLPNGKIVPFPGAKSQKIGKI